MVYYHTYNNKITSYSKKLQDLESLVINKWRMIIPFIKRHSAMFVVPNWLYKGGVLLTVYSLYHDSVNHFL
jgi:hypothetical protein